MRNDYYLDPQAAQSYDGLNGPDREITRDDIPFYAGLAREAADAGGRVLELGCGTGRVTIPMAQTGADVTGLEQSPHMLQIAREKAEAAGVTVTWVQGDMASCALDATFGLIVIPFRSFQLLLTIEKQQACLARVREHLEPGGRLALNIFNPDLLAPVRAASEGDAGVRRPEGGDVGAVFTKLEPNLRMRWVFRDEMEHLLRLSGFEIEALYGWFDQRPFETVSSEMVWLAK